MQAYCTSLKHKAARPERPSARRRSSMKGSQGLECRPKDHCKRGNSDAKFSTASSSVSSDSICMPNGEISSQVCCNTSL